MSLQTLIDHSVVIEGPAKKALSNLVKILPESSVAPLEELLKSSQAKVKTRIETYLLGIHEAFASYKKTVLQIKSLKVFEKSRVIKDVNTIENAMIDSILKSLV